MAENGYTRRRFGEQPEVHELLTIGTVPNGPVLLISLHGARRVYRSTDIAEAASDGASETKAHGRDRPRDVALHRAEPHAGGTLRVWQAL